MPDVGHISRREKYFTRGRPSGAGELTSRIMTSPSPCFMAICTDFFRRSSCWVLRVAWALLTSLSTLCSVPFTLSLSMTTSMSWFL